MFKNTIYSDASLLINEGKAGVGAVIICGGQRTAISRRIDIGTIQRLETKALLLSLLKALIEHPEISEEEIHCFTDSMDVFNYANDNHTRKNDVDLWKLFDYLKGEYKLHVHHIRVSKYGGSELMTEADKLSKLASHGSLVYKEKFAKQFNIKMNMFNGSVCNRKVEGKNLREATRKSIGYLHKGIKSVTISL